MQDPTTTTSNFPRSPAILILKEATHQKFQNCKEGTRLLLLYISLTVHDQTTTFQSARWLIVCGRTNCLVLLGVADTESLISTFSMKWIEKNNAFIWRYWTWEWETCRCYRHRSSLYKVRWFWCHKGSSSVKWSRFQRIKLVNCTVFIWVENSFLGVVSL